MKILKDILDFAFPRNCILCGRLLNDKEKVMCTFCYHELPRTDFHNDADNPVSQLFWGRVTVEHAASFFYFNKGSACQKLIHGLKYGGREDIGIETGRMYGIELKGSLFENCDFIIPVPLHRKKQRKRGYNQSEIIARGLGETMYKPVYPGIMERVEFTGTQTRKSRYDRFTNVSGSFVVKSPDICQGSHVLLVDDVVTTGSTLEACVEALKEAGVEKVSIATLAVA